MAALNASVNCQFDGRLFELWLNNSLNWTEDQLLDYACSYSQFLRFQRRLDYVRGVLYFLGASLGVVSSVLALLTFNVQKGEFAAVSFSYHRAINAIELPFMLLMFERAYRDYHSPAFLYSQTWATFFATVNGKCDNVLPTWVNVITLFIAVERAVACLAPKQFPVINRPFIVWLVVLSSFCISLLMWVPSTFAHTIMYDNRSQPVRYMPVWSEFGKSHTYKMYEKIRHVMVLIGAAFMLLATISAVVGLQRTAARSMRRRSSTRQMSVIGDPCQHVQPNEYWLLLKNLSYLQLCETVPLIFLHGFLVIAECISWDYKGGGRNAPLDYAYMEAMRLFELARARMHAGVCLDAANVAAHCFHLYWYLLFCPKVRQGFLAFLFRRTTVRPPGQPVVRRSTSANGQQKMKETPLKEPLLNKSQAKIMADHNGNGEMGGHAL